VEKYCRGGQATDDNMAHCMLQIHTRRFCNIHCSPIKTMVARTRLNVILYVHCLSFLF